MRILAIESSSMRGSVALLEEQRVIASAWHDRPNAHGENLLPLLNQLLAECGWSRNQLDRVAVGRGPGSFTGLRVGIALGQGIALGLGIPLLGVSSLRAMARGVPTSNARDMGSHDRCAVIDARRGELFVAVFTAEGEARVAPRCIPRLNLVEHVDALPRPSVVVGEVVGRVLEQLAGDAEDQRGACAFDTRHPYLRHPECDFPSASQVGCIAADLEPDAEPVAPDYLRDADAKLPDLPTSPLAQPRRPG